MLAVDFIRNLESFQGGRRNVALRRMYNNQMLEKLRGGAAPLPSTPDTKTSRTAHGTPEHPEQFEWRSIGTIAQERAEKIIEPKIEKIKADYAKLFANLQSEFLSKLQEYTKQLDECKSNLAAIRSLYGVDVQPQDAS